MAPRWLAWRNALAPRSGGLDLRFTLPAVAVSLFCMCMYCHGELASRKPAARYLTPLESQSTFSSLDRRIQQSAAKS
jgi:hypothetical protein